jgi:hypothetical protein
MLKEQPTEPKPIPPKWSKKIAPVHVRPGHILPAYERPPPPSMIPAQGPPA